MADAANCSSNVFTLPYNCFGDDDPAKTILLQRNLKEDSSSIPSDALRLLPCDGECESGDGPGELDFCPGGDDRIRCTGEVAERCSKAATPPPDLRSPGLGSIDGRDHVFRNEGGFVRAAEAAAVGASLSAN